jgi:adenosylmethionine-8-amino-7-oxononanoate aminotransferase
MLHMVSITFAVIRSTCFFSLVGHCHPHVVTQTYKQMGACATNNRYLHDNTVIFAEKIAKTLPENLKQIFYTNSGQERERSSFGIEQLFHSSS